MVFLVLNFCLRINDKNCKTFFQFLQFLKKICIFDYSQSSAFKVGFYRYFEILLKTWIFLYARFIELYCFIAELYLFYFLLVIDTVGEKKKFTAKIKLYRDNQ